MDTRRAWRVAFLAAALGAPMMRAAASVVAEPIARLTLEGGYDSNAMYDGRGGQNMGRISPDLGLLAKDHLWSLEASYGGDFYLYQKRASGGAWNHRGLLRFRDQPDERLKLSGEATGSYAIDPIGLAQLGIFRPSSVQALILKGRARATWRASERVDLSATYTGSDARFTDGTNLSMQAPGVEVMERLTPRAALGA